MKVSEFACELRAVDSSFGRTSILILLVAFLLCNDSLVIGQNCDDWESVSQEGPLAHRAYVMVYDHLHGVSVLFGGLSGADYLNDTWEWNGAA